MVFDSYLILFKSTTYHISVSVIPVSKAHRSMKESSFYSYNEHQQESNRNCNTRQYEKIWECAQLKNLTLITDYAKQRRIKTAISKKHQNCPHLMIPTLS